ncbi:MAG: hypothetical protein H0X24_01210 [Ktedonobacterales bacterium]|nr:hypothetical protein [Ktedonobacterales bacterium]
MSLETTDAVTRETALAEILGGAQAVRPDVANLARRGVIVTLSIRRWRAQTSLRFDDLGMTIDDATIRQVLATIMTLGQKRLLPRDRRLKLEQAEAEGRRILEKHSFATPWGRFVPVTAYFRWKEENQRCQGAYFALRDALVADYAGIVAEVMAQYRVAASHAYAVLCQTTPDTEAVYGAEDAYIAAFCDQIRAHIPSAEAIAATFAYTTSFAYIDVPLNEGIVEPAVALPSLEVGRIPDPAELQERQLLAMNREVLGDLRSRKTAEVDRFLTDLVTQLRGLIYEVATDVLTSMQRNQKLARGSTRQLKRLITQISQLNFYGDADVERMLDRLQATIDLPARKRDIGALEDQLRAIATVTRLTLMQIGEPPRSGRELAIPDLPTGDQLHRARRMLQLDAELDLAVVAIPGRSPRQVQLDFAFPAAAALASS